jgi:hypothetical protein
MNARMSPGGVDARQTPLQPAQRARYSVIIIGARTPESRSRT